MFLQVAWLLLGMLWAQMMLGQTEKQGGEVSLKT